MLRIIGVAFVVLVVSLSTLSAVADENLTPMVTVQMQLSQDSFMEEQSVECSFIVCNNSEDVDISDVEIYDGLFNLMVACSTIGPRNTVRWTTHYQITQDDICKGELVFYCRYSLVENGQSIQKTGRLIHRITYAPGDINTTNYPRSETESQQTQRTIPYIMIPQIEGCYWEVQYDEEILHVRRSVDRTGDIVNETTGERITDGEVLCVEMEGIESGSGWVTLILHRGNRRNSDVLVVNIDLIVNQQLDVLIMGIDADGEFETIQEALGQ